MDKIQLIIPNNKLKNYVIGWLILAVFSIATAGLLSLPPVVLRGPFFSKILPVDLIFSTSLVLHVNLSVYVWMLSIISMLWTLMSNPNHLFYVKSALIAATIGTVILIISPIIGEPEPLKNNYIPVLQNIWFFVGLGFFGSSVIIMVFSTIINYQQNFKNPLYFGLIISSFITVFAIIAFISSKQFINGYPELDNEQFYEHVFWGGGHILQIVFTNVIMVVWLYLASQAGANFNKLNKIIALTFIINLLVASLTPLFYIISSDIYEIYNYFTLQMRHGLGPPTILISLIIIFAFLRKKELKTNISSEFLSMFLSIAIFAYGGILGYMISGVNVTIPAHYHGSIVGITVGFMGLVYNFLPKLNLGKVKPYLANSQLLIYSVGQVMHVTGLWLMGGYGALRKAPGTSQDVDNLVAKIVFFSGGGLAVMGGFLFVIFVINNLYKSRTMLYNLLKLKQ